MGVRSSIFMEEDPILKGKYIEIGDSSPISDPYTGGLYIINLDNAQIEEFGNFFNDFYEKLSKKESGRRITRNALTMFKGAVFALGTKKLNNHEWKEHCASSLREVFHEWGARDRLSSDFCELYKAKGTKLSTNESNAFRDFWLFYEYFSGIDHHEADKIMSALRAILKDNTLKLENCYSDDVFSAQVEDYFSKLSEIVGFSGNKT